MGFIDPSWNQILVATENSSLSQDIRLNTEVNSNRNVFMLWSGLSGTYNCLRYAFIEDGVGGQVDSSCVIFGTDISGAITDDVGKYCSLAVDGSSVFVVFVNKTPPSKLWYGYTLDGTKSNLVANDWHFFRIEINNTIRYTSIAITESSQIHISYMDLLNNNLVHLFCEKGTEPEFKKTIVGSGNNVGKYSHIMADNYAGFISWGDDNKVYISSSLNVTTDSWETLEIDSSGGNNIRMALNILGNYRPYNTYQGFLCYSRENSLYYTSTANIKDIWDISNIYQTDTSSISIKISKRYSKDMNPYVYIVWQDSSGLYLKYTKTGFNSIWSPHYMVDNEDVSSSSLAVHGHHVFISYFKLGNLYLNWRKTPVLQLLTVG